MKRLITLRTVIGCLAFAGILPTSSSAVEIVDWAQHGGHTYYLLSPSTWLEAEAAAMRLGGHLVTIDDAAENNFVFQRFDSPALSDAGGGAVSLWIGLSDHQNEGTFVWSSGSTGNYRNWLGGQPEATHSDEDYAAIFVNHGTPGTWHDVVSDGRLGDVSYGVVEVDSLEVLTVDPPEGIVSWWPGENAAWDVVGPAGGSMKNASLGGQGAYDSGKVGRAFFFDGVNDHVQAADAPGLDLSGDFTIEGWIRRNGGTGGGTIVSKRNADNLDVSYVLFLRDGVLHFSSRNAAGAFNEVGGGPALPLNQWIHVAVTLRGTFLDFYINGIKENFAFYTASRPDTTGPVTIGASVTAAAPTATPSGPFSGYIDELTLYNRALSATEIDMIYWVGQGGKDRFDPVRSFQTAFNPNYPWSFGWLQAGTIQPGFLTDSDPNNGALYPAPAVNSGGKYRYNPSGSSHPAVLANSNHFFNENLGAGGTWIRYSPRQLGWEPGTAGQYSVVRWTAEFAGRYALSMTATGADEKPTSTEVFLYRNNDRVFPALVVPPALPEANLVNSFRGDGISVTRQLDLAAGDTINWVLGWAGDYTYDNTAVVLSAALLEREMPTIKDPIWQDPITTADPPMTGRNWRFQARNDSGADHSGMTAKIQYSATPNDPDSWIDLPGGTMTRSGDVLFRLDLSDLPVGSFAFRIATTVAGIGTTYSAPSVVYDIHAAAAHLESEFNVTSGSDPTGAKTHRGDTVSYTLRFRNSGAQSAGAMRARIRFPDNTAIPFPAYADVVPGATTPGGTKVSAGDHFAWEWSVPATRPVGDKPYGEGRTAKSRKYDKKRQKWIISYSTTFSMPNDPSHGLENDDVLRLHQYLTTPLPVGLLANKDYYVVNATAGTFQLALSVGGLPIALPGIVGRYSPLHFERTNEWQSRTVTFRLFDPTPAQEEAQANAGLSAINAEGGTLVSNARLLAGATATTVLKSVDSRVTTLVNPIRLSVQRVLGSGPVTQGGFVYFDVTARNESSLRMSGTQITVTAPTGLALRDSVFLDDNGQPAGPPMDPATGAQVAPPGTWVGNPRILDVEVPSSVPDGVPGFEQQAQFYFGAFDPGMTRKVRVTCRVQYDWDTASDPTITFNHGRVFGLLGVWQRSREAENGVNFDILEAPSDSPRPELSVWVEQESTGVIPGDSSVAAVAKVDGLNPIPSIIGTDQISRGINEIIYRVTYANFGDATANHVRLWVPIPEGTDYVTTTIMERVPPYTKRVQRGNRSVTVPARNYLPKTIVSGRILQGSDDTGVVPEIKLVGGGRWLTCLAPYLEASDIPGSEKTLEFRVKLKSGINLGTRIEQTGALVTSRELFYWSHSSSEEDPDSGSSPYLLGEVVTPGQLTYAYDKLSSIVTDNEGNPTGNDVVAHRLIYQNSSPVPVTGAGIRFTIPPGFTYYDARFVNAKGTVLGRTEVERPQPNEVLFNIGTVSGKSAGIAEVLLHPDNDSLPDENSEPNPLYRYQSSGRVVLFDSLHPETSNSPEESGEVSESDFNLSAESSELITGGLVPQAPRPWVGVITPRPALANTEVTYRILVGNSSGYGYPSEGNQNFFIRVPSGTEYVRSEIVAQDRGSINLLNLFYEPGEDSSQPHGIVNPNGMVGHSVSLEPRGFVVLDFTVRVEEGRVRDLHMRGPVLVTGGKGGSCTGPKTVTAVIDASMTPERVKDRVLAAQMGHAGSQALGPANAMGSAFLNVRDENSGESVSIAIGGTDVVTIPGISLVLIPLGGGRMVAAGGGNLIGQDGGSVIGHNGGAMVAAGAGNLVAAGAGNLITIKVPGHGLMTGAEYFSQLPQMVAAGAGNIVAAGGLNLVRRTGFESKLTNNQGTLIGLDGGSLIGLDGGSLGTIVQSLETGENSIRLPTPEPSFVQIAIQRAGMVAAGAGNLVGNSGNTLVGNNGNTIFFTGGGRILNANSVNLIRPAEMVAAGAGNMVAAGGGNILPSGAGNVLPSGAGRMVAAGAGNIVAAGAGNIISINSGMVAAGAGN